jgi:hypothetical protein
MEGTSEVTAVREALDAGRLTVPDPETASTTRCTRSVRTTAPTLQCGGSSAGAAGPSPK